MKMLKQGLSCKWPFVFQTVSDSRSNQNQVLPCSFFLTASHAIEIKNSRRSITISIMKNRKITAIFIALLADAGHSHVRQTYPVATQLHFAFA
ncbi:hypothetical protein [Herbaspirillum autotrophicum]|uniref:hypothetical protein n=1 Tax=Herbaspirillum autotrophicum TaxID=180195 RepID=UPI0012EE34C7|nr:hypothetical protein [Herbaspirillum autotrophicum]